MGNIIEVFDIKQAKELVTITEAPNINNVLEAINSKIHEKAKKGERCVKFPNAAISDLCIGYQYEVTDKIYLSYEDKPEIKVSYELRERFVTSKIVYKLLESAGYTVIRNKEELVISW